MGARIRVSREGQQGSPDGFNALLSAYNGPLGFYLETGLNKNSDGV